MKGSNDSIMLRGADAPAWGPDPEVVAKPARRRFSAKYRLRILKEADRCTQPGEIDGILDRWCTKMRRLFGQ